MMRLLGLCICTWIALCQASQIIRGVSPYELQFYKEDPFRCRKEPSKIIPRSSINDNYCDCADGSDEPGTSACANGIYYCVNKGYKGTSIFSSQVNDGICDCCDGTDEYEGKVKCKLDCAEKGEELRKQREAEKEKIQKGLQIKEQWSADATKTLAEKRGSIDGLKAEVEKLKKVVEDLEAERRGFEEKEKAEQDAISEKKKELERIEQERLQKEAPSTPESEQKEEEALKELLENKEGGNKESTPAEAASADQPPQQPSTHDETPSPPSSPSPSAPRVPHMSRTRSKFGRNPQPDQEEEEDQPSEATPQHTPQPEEETELLKSIREGSGDGEPTHELEPTIINWLFETYHNVINWLVPLLQSYNILSTEEQKRLSFWEEGKRKIEEELSEVRRDLSTAENKLRDIEDILKLDFGPNNEFFGLHGNCYEYKTREYTYSVCPYGEVKQAHTSLGKFEKWDPAYTVMSFTEGQQCWGGPKRSARVTLLCGSENELYDIHEPNKCEYAMKLNTPAACSASPLGILELDGEAGAEGHDSYFQH